MPLRYPLAALVLLLAAAPALAQMPPLTGVVAGVGPRSDVANGVAVGPDGSVVVTGTFEETLTFGDVTITAIDNDPGPTRSDAFLVKLDASGQALWGRRGGTDIFNDFGNAVAVAPDGSIYWSGTFTALATFDGGANPDGTLQAVSDFDAFLAKYSPEGDLLWLRAVLGSGQNTGEGVGVDAEGNVYWSGGFNGEATLGKTTITSAGSTDGFVAKIDPDGLVFWAIGVGGSQGDKAFDVAAVPGGGAIAMGQFRGVATFGGIPLQSSGNNDVFAVRIDDEGEVLWATKLGADGNEFGRGVAVAPDGSAYLTGSFENDILVGTDILQSAGFSEVFVAKVNPDGALAWGRRGGGTSFDFGTGVAVDRDGNVYATGYVNGTGSFSSGASGTTPFTTAGDNDAFVAAYSPAGELLALQLVGGTNRDNGGGIGVDPATSRLAIAGFFRSSITVGSSTVTGDGSNDVFVATGRAFAPPVSVEDAAPAGAVALSVYPNPSASSATVTLSLPASGAVRVAVYDVLGRRVAEVFDGVAPGGSALALALPAGLPAGAYVLRADGEGVREAVRFTVLR